MSLLTEQEIRSIMRSVKEIGENSDRALILAAESAVIEKIKAQGAVAFISPSVAAFHGIGTGVGEFSYVKTENRTIPLYRLPEGDL